MSKLDQRFEFLLTKQERTSLRELAEHRGVSQGDLIRGWIRAAAQRRARNTK